MIPVSDVSDVRYGVCDATDVDEMASLLASVFSRYEPPAVAVGESIEELERLVRLFGPRAASDGLSIVARERASGDLIGALLVDDFASPSPEGIAEACAHFGPIAALLDELDERYRRTWSSVSGQVLHLFMLGVAPQHGGKGIAQTLVRLCVENGERRGYRAAVTEATGIVSQRVFRKLGFADRFSVSYKEFSFGGRRVFESIEGHQGAVLLEKPLGKALSS
jgi:ribosomal protein S18 acetylase RimI-like enzyme